MQENLSFQFSKIERTFNDPMKKFFGLASKNTFGVFILDLNRITIKSSRNVYTVIDFIAEIGGLYGILTLAFQFFLDSLFTPRMYIISLIKHMEPLYPQGIAYSDSSKLFIPLLKKIKDKEVFSIESDDFVIMTKHLRRYFKFQVSIWTRLVACYLPLRLQS
jgi:hypothetical protein